MHIVLAVEGTRGDVAPMLELGRELRTRGHAVRLCAPPDFEPVARCADLDFHPVGEPVRAYLRTRAGAVARGSLAVMRETPRYLATSLAAQLRELPEATRDADRVVAAGIQLGARTAAELRGIPYDYVAYAPVLFPSAEHGPMGLSTPRWPSWLNRPAWAVLLRCYDRLLLPPLNQTRARLGLPPVRSAVAHFLGPRPFLAADAELAPLPRDLPFPVERVLALETASGGAWPDKLEGFLQAGPAPIYVGFGSMTDPDPEHTTRSVIEALGGLGLRAVIGAGWAGLGAGPLPGHVLAIGSAPHARLFPRMAAVVHHGGAGTTHAAARAGVPQLVVPHVFDQLYWARRVHALGVAPPALPRRRLSAARLAERLLALLDNELVELRARELGARLQDAARRGPDLASRILAPRAG